MQKAAETGPQVASDADMTVAQIDQRYREIKASQLETARGGPGVLAALCAFDLAVFTWARYPGGRVAGAAHRRLSRGGAR